MREDTSILNVIIMCHYSSSPRSIAATHIHSTDEVASAPVQVTGVKTTQSYDTYTLLSSDSVGVLLQ